MRKCSEGSCWIILQKLGKKDKGCCMDCVVKDLCGIAKCDVLKEHPEMTTCKYEICDELEVTEEKNND